jgi:hypothetical protein
VSESDLIHRKTQIVDRNFRRFVRSATARADLRRIPDDNSNFNSESIRLNQHHGFLGFGGKPGNLRRIHRLKTAGRLEKFAEGSASNRSQ